MSSKRYPPTQNFIQKTLDAALNSGVTASATLSNVTGIANKLGVFIVDRINTAGTETPAKREVIAFTATSGVTLTTLTRNADGSGTDQDHALGAIVEFGPDILWAQGVMDALDNLTSATGILDTTKLVDLTTPQTLTDKTLTSPILTTPTSDALTAVTTNGDLTLAGNGTGKVKAPTIYGAITTGTDGATVTFDCSVTNRHEVILGGNRILALSNTSTGQLIILDLIQDATGSRTVTWPSFGATATMTLATPGVVTAGKDIPTGTPVIFTTTGALPTGLTASTVYWWTRVDATTGNLSTSLANVQAGTLIATSVSQSGVHTMAVQIRWPSQTAPTLSTGKYLIDTITLYVKNATSGVVQGSSSVTGA